MDSPSPWVIFLVREVALRRSWANKTPQETYSRAVWEWSAWREISAVNISDYRGKTEAAGGQRGILLIGHTDFSSWLEICAGRIATPAKCAPSFRTLSWQRRSSHVWSRAQESRFHNLSIWCTTIKKKKKFCCWWCCRSSFHWREHLKVAAWESKFVKTADWVKYAEVKEKKSERDRERQD